MGRPEGGLLLLLQGVGAIGYLEWVLKEEEEENDEEEEKEVEENFVFLA